MKLTKIVKQMIKEAVKGGNIEQPVSNLYIKSYGLDTNGNMKIVVGFPNDRGFPIQTNGVLPETDHIISRKKITQLTDSDLKEIGMEVTKYVLKHGSKNVKSRLRIKASYENKFNI